MASIAASPEAVIAPTAGNADNDWSWPKAARPGEPSDLRADARWAAYSAWNAHQVAFSTQT
jgi:hypothetical protein